MITTIIRVRLKKYDFKNREFKIIYTETFNGHRTINFQPRICSHNTGL
jgi:hypothetical protein